MHCKTCNLARKGECMCALSLCSAFSINESWPMSHFACFAVLLMLGRGFLADAPWTILSYYMLTYVYLNSLFTGYGVFCGCIAWYSAEQAGVLHIVTVCVYGVITLLKWGGSLERWTVDNVSSGLETNIHLETSTKTSPKYRSPTFRTYSKIAGNKGPACAT